MSGNKQWYITVSCKNFCRGFPKDGWDEQYDSDHCLNNKFSLSLYSANLRPSGVDGSSGADTAAEKHLPGKQASQQSILAIIRRLLDYSVSAWVFCKVFFFLIIR